MNREEARQYILMRSKDYLTPDKSKKGFICPICQDGDGVHGNNGITTKDGVHFTCWSNGCFTNADIIDIIGLENGLTDYNDKLHAAAREFSITVDSYYTKTTPQEDFAPIAAEYQKEAKSKRNTQAAIHNTEHTSQQAEEEPDYTDFFLQANRDIGKTDYHRGLSRSTLDHFSAGYVESWRHPKAPKMKTSPRLIIPTSKSSYIARYAGDGDYINYQGKKENKSKVGKVHLFNSRALREAAKPIFIAEGEIDAMSFYEVGADAVGMGGKGQYNPLFSALEQTPPSQPLIIALDNEEGVAGNVDAIKKKCEELELSYYVIDVYGEHKDANEALNANKEAFRAAVWRAIDQVEDAEAAVMEAEREELKREAVAYSLPSFLKDIEDSKTAAFIPTGFSRLDNILDGGLYPGLYVVGAISSLGKTTFCLQVADQVAQSGHDVIIFSLEMARNELIAKSVSRITAILDLLENNTTSHAKTTRGIMTGTRYADYSQTERTLIQRSIAEYGKYAKNIYITEGIGNVGVEHIRDKVKRHIRLTGKAPVVVIDYLQIISPSDLHLTDKQAVDKNVLELKRMSRDYGIPVIGISSFNRDNYTAPVNLASFKESGAIEYSSDLLIGLQYDGMDYQEGEADKAREKRIRELMKEAVEDGKSGKAQRIQIKILKNRNGSKGDATIYFYPMFNYFTELTADEEDEEENSGGWKRSAGGYSSSQKPKKGKRATEKERLAMAFYRSQRRETGEYIADLGDIADALDKSKKQVQNLIAEYGGYTITGDTVRLDHSKDTPAFTELDEEDLQEELPF